MNQAILFYLRQRQAQLVDETTWLRGRLDRLVDVQHDDRAILDALGKELAQVTLLIEGREAPVGRLH
jgi:hypothetical protein